jgi:peptide chain release factor 2
VASPSFWKDNEKATVLSKELNDLKEELGNWENIETRLNDYLASTEVQLESRADEIRQFNKNFDKHYINVFLSGKYDKGNALLYIYSGAGGVDAQDWASMLLRMYSKYAEQQNYSFRVLHQSFGEQGGTKSVVAEVTGRYAYGKLRGESGVHRLVRISPYSAKSLRHTSFVLVDILPEIEDVKIEIDPKDLRVDTFRSSGPGGQNVNKLETAVRVTHLPTGLTVAVQSERSQAQNRAKAMALLKSRLAQLMEEKKVKEISDLRADTKDNAIEWGNQIRSYVLHPYKMVKDHRTGVETSQTDKVLGGELDEFIEAELAK